MDHIRALSPPNHGITSAAILWVCKNRKRILFGMIPQVLGGMITLEDLLGRAVCQATRRQHNARPLGTASRINLLQMVRPIVRCIVSRRASEAYGKQVTSSKRLPLTEHFCRKRP